MSKKFWIFNIIVSIILFILVTFCSFFYYRFTILHFFVRLILLLTSALLGVVISLTYVIKTR